jgi:uncharacterized protein (DUF362 family)
MANFNNGYLFDFHFQRSRKDFLKTLGALGLGALSAGSLLGGLTSCKKQSNAEGLTTVSEPKTAEMTQGVVVATGTDYRAMVRRGLEAMGGLSVLVQKGDIVVVKPNIGWDRTVEQAACTHPDVVAELVKQCRDCGAGEVRVFDLPCNDARRTYERSGIASAAKAEGAVVSFVDEARFTEVAIPNGVALQSFLYYDDCMDADVIINVPVAKDHGLTKLTLGLKNLMGVIGGNRGEWHLGISEKLVDLWTVVRPQLTVMDATRILTANGPTGGDLRDVKTMNTIAFSTDPIAIDSYAATLFGIKGEDVGYISKGYQRGLGEIDLNKVNIENIAV